RPYARQLGTTEELARTYLENIRDGRDAENHLAQNSPLSTNAVPINDDGLAVDASPEVVAAASAAVTAAAEAASIEGLIRQGKSKAESIDAGDGVIRQASPQERKTVEAKPKSLLGGQFVGNEKGEYTRVGEKRVALFDDGSQIQLKDRELDTFAAGVELAKAKGWTAIEVEGSEKFRREAWLTASEAGLEVQGYEPNQKDKQELEKRLAKRGGEAAAKTGRSAAAKPAPAGDAAAADVQSSLSEAQDQVLGASKNYVAPNMQSGLYAGKVLAETAHHIVVTVDGRANSATALEKSKLGGVPFKLNETLKIQFRDGMAVAPSIKNQRSKSISR
ncbi:LPD7 domain-containing protein, partial [Trinickia mobilis]|uniref:LPD7 domain-containing protein n=1 Tax=Trinickia mobilis TaxID=2816356 RepID=UPI002867F8AF